MTFQKWLSLLLSAVLLLATDTADTAIVGCRSVAVGWFSDVTLEKRKITAEQRINRQTKKKRNFFSRQD